mmetsp:Transcript_13136/g.21324  ORF Transcript_13136/g.21324 Transcript_13136/m.21324 type:complete len:93 (+) Transcript_13136:1931-2209(+)
MHLLISASKELVVEKLVYTSTRFGSSWNRFGSVEFDIFNESLLSCCFWLFFYFDLGIVLLIRYLTQNKPWLKLRTLRLTHAYMLKYETSTGE